MLMPVAMTSLCRQQRLATWISSISDLHKSHPAAAASYSRPMPDVELLMQVCVVL